jgi:Transposase DDE domain
MRKRRETPSRQHDATDSSHLSIGEILLSRQRLEELAMESKTIFRKPRKLDPCDLLAQLLAQCPHASPSYNDLASGIESTRGLDPSKQAVALRLNPAFESFLERVLGEIIAMKIQDDFQTAKLDPIVFRGYLRVLVQDSTIIKLPAALFESFSGVSNAHSTVCNARIQAVYDLISGRLISFSIDPYSKNDLSAAPELPLMEGDLVLRDRGYLTAGEIQRHCDEGAHFIYRHKTGMIYLDAETHKPIDLAALLKERGSLDREVLLNNPARTRVRLLAEPVSKESADLRRMRAKKETKGHNPSKAMLELMDWTIFLTNIPSEQASFKEILGIYGLRWRIEVIFKAWKSHLKFDVVHRVSKRQLHILLKARLIVIAAASNLYRRLERILWGKHRKRLSLLKFMKHIAASPAKLQRIIDFVCGNHQDPLSVERALVKYCCHDKRKSRRNFNEMWELWA